MMVFCNRCGSENQDDSLYCWKCGEPISTSPREVGIRENDKSPEPAKEKHEEPICSNANKRKRTGVAFAVLVAAILVIAGAAIYLNNNGGDSDKELYTMTPGTYNYESLFTLNNDETICYFADVSIELTTESIEMGEIKEYVSDSKYWNSGWEYHVTQAHDQYLGTPEKTNLDESEQDVQDIMKESFDFLDNWIPMPVCVKFVNEDGETAYGYKFINNMDSIYVSTEGIIYEMYHYVDGIPNDHYDFYLEGWKRELKLAPTYY